MKTLTLVDHFSEVDNIPFCLTLRSINRIENMLCLLLNEKAPSYTFMLKMQVRVFQQSTL